MKQPVQILLNSKNERSTRIVDTKENTVLGEQFSTGYCFSMEVKTRIIEAATELFLLNDYDTVSVREIALLAGVSNTYIHKLFGKKEELFTALLDSSDAEFFASISNLPREAIVPELLNHHDHRLFQLVRTGCISKQSCDTVNEWLTTSKTFQVISNSVDTGTSCNDVLQYLLVKELIFGGLAKSSGVFESLGWNPTDLEVVGKCWHTFILGYATRKDLAEQYGKETKR